ncbi:hypothetical protein POPTR_003G079550v4 [Populus trichocarpa]|uniref:Uncharacterized protein n=1 Tax=Populus trichocarpa TaxID=3694 RepID=A0ACC0T8I3_POPTR|nr:hypothetical protein POPTR_003G079550v4 [Populus trichocarpa]
MCFSNHLLTLFGSCSFPMWYKSGPILFKGVFVLKKTLYPLFASNPVLQLADLRWQPLINACTSMWSLCCARISGQPEFNWLMKMSPPLKIHFIYGGYLLF